MNARSIIATLEYPRSEGRPDAVEVELVDVRAACDLRITFDFDGNGWRIERSNERGEWEFAAFVPAGP